MYVRVDSIGQAIRDSGTMAQPINEAGYRVAYAIAADNLRLGRTVISDSVNPIHLSRDAWISVANRARVRVAEVEIICSDPLQHRQRVETRPSDINGLRLPTWEEVIAREYEPWDRQHIVIDTAGDAWRRASKNFERPYRNDRPRHPRVSARATGNPSIIP
jgi:predicted kinase